MSFIIDLIQAFWSWLDPIVKIIGALATLGGIAVAGWKKMGNPMWRKWRSRVSVTVGFEVHPIGFVANLTDQLPHIEVRFYAINYLDRHLALFHLISNVRIGPNQELERIPLADEEIILPSQSARIVICRRQLTIHEIAIMPRSRWRESGSVRMTAKARDRRVERSYIESSLAIDGWIVFPTSP